MVAGILYVVQQTEPLELSGNDPLLRRKELIYTGSFEKKTKTESIKFAVDETVLQHWHNTFIAMSANGVDVPVPKEHTADPDARRATVVRTEIAQNKRGLRALYGYFKFKDAESLKLAEQANVSIFVPDEYTDGKSNKYFRPIRHVALTDYPVIPGLEGFETIALSEVLDMSLSAIAKKLGVKDDGDEKEIEAAVSKAIDALLKKVEAATSNPPPNPNPPTPNPPNPNPADPPTNPNPAPANPPVVSASFVNMLRDNRTMKLSQLVQCGKISPVVRDALTAQYCNDKTLSLSLSSAGDDGFETTVAALAKNESIVSFKEKTGPQALALSHPLDSKENPLLKDAERRAKEAAA